MTLYKAVKNFLARYIFKDEVEKYHKDGYTIYKEVDNMDVMTVQPTEEIPENFFD